MAAVACPTRRPSHTFDGARDSGRSEPFVSGIGRPRRQSELGTADRGGPSIPYRGPALEHRPRPGACTDARIVQRSWTSHSKVREDGLGWGLWPTPTKSANSWDSASS